MIRHIVTFQFAATDPEGRAAAANRLRAALEPLANSIPGVQSLEVGIDDGGISGHWDAALVSVHDSAEALAAYQSHPEHLAALAVIAELTARKSVVDFELGSAQ
ncbi:Dabb family protein [Leucobacter sp. USCH14]|uniref:Dabb family protein n=1 Tax=Leucobacter sp. USCH14 TaxID=3024838 RepID=UPI0030B66A0E